MSAIDAIGFLPPSVPVAPLDAPWDSPAPTAGTRAAGPAFAQWFLQQVDEVNGRIAASDQQLQALAAGETQNLHQVMLGLEEARLSFQLLTQVRNKVLEAYQDILRMQI